MSRGATIQQCIRELRTDETYNVPVLKGAPQALCSERHLRTKYHTNREIKYWSTYFLLKALTTSGDIQDWRGQRSLILTFLQLSESVFYRHLNVLQEKGLLTVDEDFNIRLTNYKEAAAIIGLFFDGLIHVPYNPFKNAGKQIFQYFLRVEEIRHNQCKQLDALVYHLDKNPPLRNLLLLHLVHMGADQQRLHKDRKYLQERLLELQKVAFRHGSDILRELFEYRADINRGIRGIQGHHDYISKTSVSYLKRRLHELKLVQVQKVCVESKVRSRVYVPDPTATGGQREGYKWIPRIKDTAWFLTDQINPVYELLTAAQRYGVQKKTA